MLKDPRIAKFRKMLADAGAKPGSELRPPEPPPAKPGAKAEPQEKNAAKP